MPPHCQLLALYTIQMASKQQSGIIGFSFHRQLYCDQHWGMEKIPAFKRRTLKLWRECRFPQHHRHLFIHVRNPSFRQSRLKLKWVDLLKLLSVFKCQIPVCFPLSPVTGAGGSDRLKLQFHLHKSLLGKMDLKVHTSVNIHRR